MRKRFQVTFTIILFSVLSSRVYAKPICLAHRGEHKIHGENSIEGIRSALELGADGIEIDLRHTSDHIAIGVHDYFLWRVANDRSGKGCRTLTPIPSLKLSEIRENCELKNSEQIATLAEILDSVKNTNAFVLLQFKDTPSDETIDLIKNYPRKDRMRVHSFWDEALDQFEMRSAQLGFHVDALKISKYWPRISEKYGNDLWWPFHWLIEYMPELRKRETGLFLVDSESSMKEADRLMVNYVTTDDPAICRN